MKLDNTSYLFNDQLLSKSSLMIDSSAPEISPLLHTILDKYKNPFSLVVRELLSNAIDATLEAEKYRQGVRPPAICYSDSINNLDSSIYEFLKLSNSYSHLPSSSYHAGQAFAFIEVKDNGLGMTKEFLEKEFLKLFYSTKREDNTLLGGVGLGSKTPLYLNSSFFVKSIADTSEGRYRTIVEISKENDQTFFGTTLEHSLTEEDLGTTVLVSFPKAPSSTITNSSGKIRSDFDPAFQISYIYFLINLINSSKLIRHNPIDFFLNTFERNLEKYHLSPDHFTDKKINNLPSPLSEANIILENGLWLFNQTGSLRDSHIDILFSVSGLPYTLSSTSKDFFLNFDKFVREKLNILFGLPVSHVNPYTRIVAGQEVIEDIANRILSNTYKETLFVVDIPIGILDLDVHKTTILLTEKSIEGLYTYLGKFLEDVFNEYKASLDFANVYGLNYQSSDSLSAVPKLFQHSLSVLLDFQHGGTSIHNNELELLKGKDDLQTLLFYINYYAGLGNKYFKSDDKTYCFIPTNICSLREDIKAFEFLKIQSSNFSCFYMLERDSSIGIFLRYTCLVLNSKESIQNSFIHPWYVLFKISSPNASSSSLTNEEKTYRKLNEGSARFVNANSLQSNLIILVGKNFKQLSLKRIDQYIPEGYVGWFLPQEFDTVSLETKEDCFSFFEKSFPLLLSYVKDIIFLPPVEETLGKNNNFFEQTGLRYSNWQILTIDEVSKLLVKTRAKKPILGESNIVFSHYINKHTTRPSLYEALFFSNQDSPFFKDKKLVYIPDSGNFDRFLDEGYKEGYPCVENWEYLPDLIHQFLFSFSTSDSSYYKILLDSFLNLYGLQLINFGVIYSFIKDNYPIPEHLNYKFFTFVDKLKYNIKVDFSAFNSVYTPVNTGYISAESSIFEVLVSIHDNIKYRLRKEKKDLSYQNKLAQLLKNDDPSFSSESIPILYGPDKAMIELTLMMFKAKYRKEISLLMALLCKDPNKREYLLEEFKPFLLAYYR